MVQETGRYLVIAHLILPCYPVAMRKLQQFPSLLLVDEYGGWLKFHCAYNRGAFALYVQAAGRGWISQDSRWAIDNVQMLSKKQYLEALHVLTETSSQPGRPKRNARNR